jgi:hypothetical protein
MAIAPTVASQIVLNCINAQGVVGTPDPGKSPSDYGIGQNGGLCNCIKSKLNAIGYDIDFGKCLAMSLSSPINIWIDFVAQNSNQIIKANP